MQRERVREEGRGMEMVERRDGKCIGEKDGEGRGSGMERERGERREERAYGRGQRVVGRRERAERRGMDWTMDMAERIGM